MKSTDNRRYRITEYTTGFYIEEEVFSDYWLSVNHIAYSSFDKAYKAVQDTIEMRNHIAKYPIIHWESK